MTAHRPVCKCGRRKYTTADLERWRAEFGAGTPAKNPPWAAEICWTTDNAVCLMRPLTPRTT